MSTDEEFARKLQQEELASAGGHFSLQDINSTQELDALTALEIVRILEQEEEDVASQNSVQLIESQKREINEEDSHEKAGIDEQDEAQSDSFQLAMKLQKEEEEQAEQEKMESAAMMSNCDSRVGPPDINPCNDHYFNCSDSQNSNDMDWTDEEYAGAVAAISFVQPYHRPERPDYRDLSIASDEQMAKLIQEQEQAEELARSLELALQLQEKEEDRAKRRNPKRPDRPGSQAYMNAGPGPPHQNREMDEATRRVITRIVEEEKKEAHSNSLQLAMKLQKEERERLAISVDSDSDDDGLDFNPHRADWNRDCHVNEWTDEDFARAVAATPCVQRYRSPDWHNNRDLSIATDEQVAKLIQEQEQAEEMAHSLELALQLQEKEEDRAKKRNYNPNRPGSQAHWKQTEKRPNQGLRQRAVNVNSSVYHHPQGAVGSTSNHPFGDVVFYDGIDPFLLQADGNDTDRDAFLLPPGLQNFQVEDGHQNLDIITIPEDSNFEDLLELADNLGDVSCGLSASQIDKLPTRTWSAVGQPSGGDEVKCSICLSEFVPNETVRTLSCKHDFHKQCVDPWLKKKPNCPTCRTDIKV